MTATHLIVVGQGRLIADASVAELTAASGGSVVRVRTEEAPRLRDLLAADGVSVTSTERDLLTVTGLSSAEIGQIAAEARIALIELTPQQASLEEAFMELTRDAVEFGTPMAGGGPMTAIAMEPDAHLGVTQLRTVVSEWIKFRSLRSTWWSIGVALLISVGLGILFSDLRGNDIQTHGGFEPDQTALSLRGFYLAQLAVGVLGVLFITGEYSTGMIRATLSAVPRRVPVWVAKIAVFAGVIFVITLVAAFVAFLGGQAALSGYQFHGQVVHGPERQHRGHHRPRPWPAAQPRACRSAIPARSGRSSAPPCSWSASGLLGLGCGFIIRNTGGAIAALFGLLLVLPLLAQALPSSLQQHVSKYLPLLAGTAGMNTVGRHATNCLPGAGLGVFAIYVVAALGIGLYVLRRRDA